MPKPFKKRIFCLGIIMLTAACGRPDSNLVPDPSRAQTYQSHLPREGARFEVLDKTESKLDVRLSGPRYCQTMLSTPYKVEKALVGTSQLHGSVVVAILSGALWGIGSAATPERDDVDKDTGMFKFSSEDEYQKELKSHNNLVDVFKYGAIGFASYSAVNWILSSIYVDSDESTDRAPNYEPVGEVAECADGPIAHQSVILELDAFPRRIWRSNKRWGKKARWTSQDSVQTDSEGKASFRLSGGNLTVVAREKGTQGKLVYSGFRLSDQEPEPTLDLELASQYFRVETAVERTERLEKEAERRAREAAEEQRWAAQEERASRSCDDRASVAAKQCCAGCGLPYTTGCLNRAQSQRQINCVLSCIQRSKPADCD